MHCEGLRGLWDTCPSPVIVDTAAGMSTVVNMAAVLFLVFLALIAVIMGSWVSSMTD